MTELIEKKKSMSRNQAKKYFENLTKLSATAGVHKEDGQKLAPWTDTRHQNVKLITKACNLEFGNEFTPQRHTYFKSYLTGKFFKLRAFQTYIQPPRPFIRLSNLRVAKKAITQTFKNLINGFKNTPNTIFKQVAENAAFWQRSRIETNELSPKNKPMTIEYKGFNHPGFMTGQLLDNIKGKVNQK